MTLQDMQGIWKCTKDGGIKKHMRYFYHTTHKRTKGDRWTERSRGGNRETPNGVQRNSQEKFNQGNAQF